MHVSYWRKGTDRKYHEKEAEWFLPAALTEEVWMPSSKGEQESGVLPEWSGYISPEHSETDVSEEEPKLLTWVALAWGGQLGQGNDEKTETEQISTCTQIWWGELGLPELT